MRRTTLILAAAMLMIAGGFTLHSTRAQKQSDIKRTDLQRHDLSVPGRCAWPTKLLGVVCLKLRKEQFWRTDVRPGRDGVSLKFKF